MPLLARKVTRGRGDDEEDLPKNKKKPRVTRSWEESYAALVDYKQHNGDCSVPRKYKEDAALAKWVSTQRNRYCSMKMTPEERHKLTQLEFDWETLEEKQVRAWNNNFESLELYRKKNRDCCVPRRFKEDPSLGIWVHRQRQLYKRGKLLLHRQEKLESVKFTWSLQSRTEAVVDDYDNDNDLDSAKGSNKNGESSNNESYSSDQARGSRRSIRRSARKVSLADDHATEETDDDHEDLDVGVDSGDHVKVGTRLSVLWGGGCYYGGVVTKTKNQDNKRICYVEYYDAENVWHDLGMEQFSIVYPLGTQVYKNFPGHGFYFGEITVSKHDKDGLFYQVEYSDGNVENCTDEPGSAQLLEELCAAVLAAKRKREAIFKDRSGQ
jgi:hypothetical protein